MSSLLSTRMSTEPDATTDCGDVQMAERPPDLPPELPRAPTSVMSVPTLHNGYSNMSQRMNITRESILDALRDESSPLSTSATCILLTNQLFWSRVITLLITVFLFLLSTCYAFGQVLDLQLTDFWCPQRSLADVRAHSQEIQSNVGEYGTCWRTKLFTVSEESLWTTESYSSERSLDDATNILKCVLFCMLSVTGVVCILVYSSQLFVDIYRYKKGTLQPKPKRSRTVSSANHNKWKSKIFHQISTGLAKWNEFFMRDSAPWCARKICTEMFEIFLQTAALLYYNGYSLFGSRNEVVLAYKPEYIELFSIFLALNCFFVCAAWMSYAAKPLLCHGFLFEILLYFADVIFDIFYALFPLIVHIVYDDYIFVVLFIVFHCVIVHCLMKKAKSFFKINT